jgi:hypothetical protein
MGGEILCWFFTLVQLFVEKSKNEQNWVDKLEIAFALMILPDFARSCYDRS